jgi:hypothetical protein
MKTQNLYFALLLNLISIASCNESQRVSYETKVVTTVHDDENKPVADIKVTVTHDFLQQNEKTVRVAHTNSSGQAITSAISLPGVWIRTQSANYYPTFEEEVSNLAGIEDYAMKPLKTLHHSVVIRKINNPIALYAKNIDTPMPDNDKWIGFDLEKADWIKPHGQGLQSDVEFYLVNTCNSVEYRGANTIKSIENLLTVEHANIHNKNEFFKGPSQFYGKKQELFNYSNTIAFYFGNWQGLVKMRVPHAKGGIIAEKEKYLFYAKYPQVHYVHDFAPEMRMPHHAPTDGYQEEYKWEKSTKDGSAIDEKLGFFIKTRVKLDEQGNELSAHYAKFITDVQIDIRGRIKFTSYFNPTPNDTNLEFDLKKNLFKNLKDSETPFLP